MHIQDILYYLFWASLFVVMMRFGCGAHVMGHGHHQDASASDHSQEIRVPSTIPDRVIDPVCGMNVQTSAAKTAPYLGHIYYFCSQKCRERFESAPESFAKSASGAALTKENHHGCC
jgi:YHS domain-containing protein